MRTVTTGHDYAKLADAERADAMVLKYGLAEVGGDDGGRRVRFVFSDGGVDRDNDTISPDGWDLSSFVKNPVILFAHSHRDLPIGKAVSVGVEDGKLVGVVEFAAHAMAQTVYDLVKGGFLRATSVGFRPLEFAQNPDRNGVDFKRQELLETSIVPVPANPRALMQAAASGIDLAPMREWLKSMGEAMPVHVVKDTETVALADVSAVTGKLESQIAGLQERLAAVGDQLSALRAPADDEERGVVPKDASRTAAEAGAEWSAPKLRDFTAEPWAELGATARRTIAGHFAWSAAMPPLGWADLKLAHHRASDGAVVLAGVRAAAARLHRSGLPVGDVEAVRAHLGRHYRQFGETAPWDRDAAAWEAYERDAHADDAATAKALSVAFAPESRAVLADCACGADDDVVLDLLDDAEELYDVDAEGMREALATVVRDTVGALVAEATERTINRLRGRVD